MPALTASSLLSSLCLDFIIRIDNINIPLKMANICIFIEKQAKQIRIAGVGAQNPHNWYFCHFLGSLISFGTITKQCATEPDSNKYLSVENNIEYR